MIDDVAFCADCNDSCFQTFTNRLNGVHSFVDVWNEVDSFSMSFKIIESYRFFLYGNQILIKNCNERIQKLCKSFLRPFLLCDKRTILWNKAITNISFDEYQYHPIWFVYLYHFNEGLMIKIFASITTKIVMPLAQRKGP